MVADMMDAIPKGKRRLTGLLYSLLAITIPEMTHAVAAVIKGGSLGLSTPASAAIVGVSVAYFMSKFGEKPGAE